MLTNPENELGTKQLRQADLVPRLSELNKQAAQKITELCDTLTDILCADLESEARELVRQLDRLSLEADIGK